MCACRKSILQLGAKSHVDMKHRQSNASVNAWWYRWQACCRHVVNPLQEVASACQLQAAHTPGSAHVTSVHLTGVSACQVHRGHLCMSS
jgi:hypothetical protein